MGMAHIGRNQRGRHQVHKAVLISLAVVLALAVPVFAVSPNTQYAVPTAPLDVFIARATDLGCAYVVMQYSQYLTYCYTDLIVSENGIVAPSGSTVFTYDSQSQSGNNAQVRYGSFVLSSNTPITGLDTVRTVGNVPGNAVARPALAAENETSYMLHHIYTVLWVFMSVMAVFSVALLIKRS